MYVLRDYYYLFMNIENPLREHWEICLQCMVYGCVCDWRDLIAPLHAEKTNPPKKNPLR